MSVPRDAEIYRLQFTHALRQNKQRLAQSAEAPTFAQKLNEYGSHKNLHRIDNSTISIPLSPSLQTMQIDGSASFMRRETI